MKLLRILITALLPLVCAGCHSLDDDRVPPAPVHISFVTEPEWTIYGTPAALDHRSFVRDLRLPKDFPYKTGTYTGFGGVLLVSSVLNEPQAFDLACPVERDKNVRIFVNDDNLAECPKCHSTYDVFSLAGHPVSGEAAQKGWGLRVYRVSRGMTEYMVVSN